MQALSSDRLDLAAVRVSDAAFIYELMNAPGWLKNIGDRGIRNTAEAAAYLEKSAMAFAAHPELGLYVIRLRGSNTAVGIISLLKRMELDYVDVGFALLPQFEGHGYAREGTQMATNHAHTNLELETVGAIALKSNTRSVHLLETLGFVANGMVEQGAEREELGLWLHHQPEQ